MLSRGHFNPSHSVICEILGDPQDDAVKGEPGVQILPACPEQPYKMEQALSSCTRRAGAAG